MPVGKIAAQCCHASMGVLLKYIKVDHGHNNITHDCFFPSPVVEWINGSFAKIVLKAPSLDDLLKLEQQAKEKDIPYCLITDNGTTVFNNEPTITCIAIGPWHADIIEEMTQDFKLL
jgi:peptidyl-tRNA hydrolase